MKRLYILLLIAIGLIACQEIVYVSEVDDNTMRFNLISPNITTKVSSGEFEAMDQIGLYVTDYVDDTTPMPLQISGNRANNVVVTFDGSEWTPEDIVYWGVGKSDVYAYYPYFSAVTDINNQLFEVAADQTGEGYWQSDLLWAKAEGVCRGDGAVNLHMRHLMSKLTVKVVAGEDYIGSLPEDACVQLHSTVTSVLVDIERGSLAKDPYSGAKSITMRNLGLKTSDGVKAVVYEAIVVPQMLEAMVPLLEINSKSVSYLLEDSFNFRPGVAYTYTVTLNASTTEIKVEIDCELEDWNNVGGDQDGSDDDGDDDGESGDQAEYTDLSAAGSSNCYHVQRAGDYKFKTVIGNTDATVGNVKSVEVLWESFGTDKMPNVGDLVTSVSYRNGYVCFSIPENFRDGNAVIAVRNSKGTILWSWHIWCLKEGWQEHVYYNDAGIMMDRNLGATSAEPGSVGALGLIYKWGDRAPYMGSSSISSNVSAVSTGTWVYESYYGVHQDPMVFVLYGGAARDSWSSVKTVHDPCPVGWRVPDGGEQGIWAKALGETSSVYLEFDKMKGGVNLSYVLGDYESIWYPASGYRDGSNGNLGNVNSNGAYWSVTPADPTNEHNYQYYQFNFMNNGAVYFLRYNDRMHGYPVRCQKE